MSLRSFKIMSKLYHLKRPEMFWDFGGDNTRQSRSEHAQTIDLTKWFWY